MPNIFPSISPELLRRLGSSNVDRAAEVLSELRTRGYLEVEGDSWWKAEVLIAMMSECADGEANSVRAQIISANESPTTDEVHVGVAAASRTISLLVLNDSRESHNLLPPADAPVATSAATPSPDRGIAGPSPSLPDIEAGPGEVSTTVTDHQPLWLLYARKPINYVVMKHPKIVSAVSTVLVTVGGIVLLPGVSACIGSILFAPHAVKAAGAIAVAVGKWLKGSVDSSMAKAAAQPQPSGQVAVEDINGGQTERATPALR